MFETVQIARRHLLRFEYPELATALESATSPAGAGAMTGAFAAWVGGQTTSRDEIDPPHRAPREAEEDDTEPAFVNGWALFPYY